MNSNTLIEIELKGLIEIITTQIKELFSIEAFNVKIRDQLKSEYNNGIEAADKEIKPEMNIVPTNPQRQLEALYNYVEQNMQTHVDSVGDNLRQELQRGLLNRENKKQLISRIKRVFKDDKGVINKLKMVVRTETNRANNTGRLEAAEQAAESGIKLKKWLDVAPYQKGVSSGFCATAGGHSSKTSAMGKYGTPEQAIALDKNFIVKYKNKTIRVLAPPMHCNCRTVLRVVRVNKPNDTLQRGSL